MREDVYVERGGDGRVEHEGDTVLAAERGKSGQISRLDERVGRHLGEQTGDLAAMGLEEATQAGEVEYIGVVEVVLGGRGGEFLEDGDGVEVEPAELNPAGAAERGLDGVDGSEGGVGGGHAAGCEMDIVGSEPVAVGGGESLADVELGVGGRGGEEAFGFGGRE